MAAGPQGNVVDFEGLPAGYIVDVLFKNHGMTGNLTGVVLVGEGVSQLPSHQPLAKIHFQAEKVRTSAPIPFGISLIGDWIGAGTLQGSLEITVRNRPDATLSVHQFDDVFFIAMTHAAKAVKGKCVRLDREDYTGDIITQIKKRIRKSIAVIADLSGANPNVLYEVGYSHAMGRPTVNISHTPLTQLPFDVSTMSTLEYEIGQTVSLRSRLARRLKKVLKDSSS